MMSFVWINWKKQTTIPVQKGKRNSVSQKWNVIGDKVRRTSQDSRKASISLNAEFRLPKVNENETESDQLHKVRDVRDRIAKINARRTSFSKVNARKNMPIRLHGTKDRESKRRLSVDDEDMESSDCDEGVAWEPVEVTKEPLPYKQVVDLESFPVDKTAQTEVIHEPKVFPKKKKHSVSWAVEEKGVGRRQSVRKSLLGGELGRKSSVDIVGRKRSETFPRSLADTTVLEAAKKNSITYKSTWNKEEQAGYDTLPRLSRADIRTLYELDKVLQAEGTNRSLFSRHGVNTQRLVEKRRSTIRMPSISGSLPQNDHRVSISGAMTEFPALRTTNNRNASRRFSRGNQDTGNRDFPEERRNTLRDGNIINNLKMNQSRKADETYNRNSVPAFPPTPRLAAKRLSEAFREVQECRYLRMYTKL